MAGLVSLIGSVGEVTAFTLCYRVYLVQIELMHLFFLCAGALGDGKSAITVKQRHTSYAQLPHSFGRQTDHSPNLAILITTFRVIVCSWLGLFLPTSN